MFAVPKVTPELQAKVIKVVCGHLPEDVFTNPTNSLIFHSPLTKQEIVSAVGGTPRTTRKAITSLLDMGAIVQSGSQMINNVKGRSETPRYVVDTQQFDLIKHFLGIDTREPAHV